MSKFPSLLLTLLAIVFSSGQPTVVDFDFCEDRVAMLQMSRTLDIVVEQTKALQLSVKQMKETSENRYKNTTDITTTTQEIFTDLKEDVLTKLNQMEKDIHEKVHQELSYAVTNISANVEIAKQGQHQAISQLSDNISDLSKSFKEETIKRQEQVLDLKGDITKKLDQLSKFYTTKIGNGVNDLKMNISQKLSNLTQIISRTMLNHTRTLEDTLLREFQDEFTAKVNQTSDIVTSVNDTVVSSLEPLLDSKLSSMESKCSTYDYLEKERNKQNFQDLKNLLKTEVGELKPLLEEDGFQSAIMNMSVIVSQSLSSSTAQSMASLQNLTRWLMRLQEDITSTKTSVTNMAQNSAGPEQSGTIRLVNGTERTNGRVEIFVSGKWGTVCDDSWDGSDAAVVCRQLGYCGGSAVQGAKYGRAADDVPIHLDDVACSGSEVNILICRQSTLGRHNCGHNEDAGVKCRYCTA